MVKIDKTDGLYSYLSGLNIDDVDEVYLELATAGRYTRDEVRTYFSETFRGSIQDELEDKEAEKIVDYYADLKKIKPLKKSEQNSLLKNYKNSPDEKTAEKILNSKLKDVFYWCINYKTLHKDVDIQDLVQVASLGVIEALNKYDETKKISFDDYILYYVRKNIIKEFEVKNNG